MAESDLSSEVNARTVLPAPTIGDPSVDSDGNVVVSWTNNDDSTDGGIDVERFSDEPFTDSFEAQNLSGFAGETGQFSTTTAVSFDGSTAVEKTTDGNYAGIYVDDSITDPSKAQTATTYYYNSSGRGGVYLADSADGSGYAGYFTGGALFIQKIADSATLEANLVSINSGTLSADTWYRISITHDGVDNITARVEDGNGTTVIGPISATDADYRPDTVGVWAYSGGTTLDLLSIDSQSKLYDDSVAFHYRFDTPTDGTFDDSSPNGVTATTVNSPQSAQTPYGTGFAGDESAYGKIAEADAPPINSPFAVVFYYDDTRGSSFDTIIAKNAAGSNLPQPLDLRTGGNTDEWEIKGPEVTFSAGLDETGHIYGFRFNADGSVDYYLDGSFVTSKLGNVLSDQSNPIWIGNRGNESTPMGGDLDELRLITDAPSDATMETLTSDPTVLTNKLFTTVASGLSPSTTSYTDTSVSSGETYEYRVERNTDHASVKSGVSDSIRARKVMTRTATLTGDGQLDATRSGVSKTRTAAIEGDGQLTASRAPMELTRTATLTGNGQLTASRATMGKTRRATLQGDGEIEAFADFSEALGEPLAGLFIDYDPELKAFATEFFDETPVDEQQDLMVLRFTSRVETPLRFAIESDVDGDGDPEHRSRWIEFEQGHVPRIYPSVPTDAVQYRVLMRGLRTQDVLRRIDTAIVYD